MRSDPTISIITPTYNQDQFLERTIDSILSQDYENLEYIVVDGGSTDNTPDILKKYKKHLTYWISEPDKGQSHAINKGLHVANGEILNWINSDDYYEKDTLSIVAENFKNSLGPHIVSGRSRVFDNESEETLHYTRGVDIYSGNLAKTMGWARMDQPETFFTREALDRVGFLNESLHYVMDREWWIRFLWHFGPDRVERISDTLVNFRSHKDSKSLYNQKGFHDEQDTYFYQMADMAGLESVKDLMEKTTDCKGTEKNLVPLYFREDIPFLKEVVHYYLLLRANQYYERLETDLAQEYLDIIQPNLLQERDRKWLRQLKLRSRLPNFLVAFLRKGKRSI